MPFRYHDRRPKKCKYCDKEAKRNEKNGRNKGYYRTCGSDICLRMQYKDERVSKLKKGRGERICEHCGGLFQIDSQRQKWCKKCVPDDRARSIMRRYGLSKGEYLKMVEDIGGVCPICRKRRAILIDHNHKTGKVRGIICGHCNIILESVEDKEVLIRVLNYLGIKL